MGMSTGGSGGLNSEINVTPLVDVMLVLLVIFIITRITSYNVCYTKLLRSSPQRRGLAGCFAGGSLVPVSRPTFSIPASLSAPITAITAP